MFTTATRKLRVNLLAIHKENLRSRPDQTVAPPVTL